MINPSAPIGVLDSGIGGFSVVAKIREQLPHENIVYFGDNAHCPYGLRSVDEVRSLAQGIVDFLLEKKVKAIVIACNTISTQAEGLKGHGIPLLEIIDPVCRAFSIASPRKVGIIATSLTTKSHAYEKRLKAENPSLETIGVSAPNLAALVESGNFKDEEIDREIENAMAPIKEKDVKYVIWGCTHYPIVTNSFTTLYPDITFFDPAVFQIEELFEILRNQGGLNPQEGQGEMTLYTSGSSESAIKAIEKLRLPMPKEICENTAF